MRYLMCGLFGLLLLVTASIADACQAIREPVFDIQGNILQSVSIAITKTHGGATATLYSDAACTVTTTNPVLTGADGTFTVFVKDGVYTVTPSKSGYSFVTVTDINVFDPVLENLIPNSTYQSTDITLATNGAIDQISTTVATLVISQPASTTVNKTVPSNVSLLFVGQGSLTVSVGTTLTVNGPVTNLTDHDVFLGTGTTTFGAGAGQDPYNKRGFVTVTYSASMTIDCSLGETFRITPNNGTAFSIALPTRPAYNRLVRIEIINTTGGALGVATFTSYKKGAAWAQPATGFTRFIEFRYDGTAWKEVSRSAADVTN